MITPANLGAFVLQNTQTGYYVGAIHMGAVFGEDEKKIYDGVEYEIVHYGVNPFLNKDKADFFAKVLNHIGHPVEVVDCTNLEMAANG